jgi:hypothetical protein
MRSYILLVCMSFSSPLAGVAARNPLLPKPQEISYGTSQLQVAGLEIGFSSRPTPQDRLSQRN